MQSSAQLESVVVGTRLIARMLKDMARERGLELDEVGWLDEPAAHESTGITSETYTLQVIARARRSEQIFLREDIEGVAESTQPRTRVEKILDALLTTLLA
jgi:hypothetical protein